jgi:hypothetical protein
VIVSPIWAVMFEGSKISLPGPPTVTTWLLEMADVVVGDAAGAVAVVAAALVVVAAIPLAAFWKASNWVPGLMAKTIPCWQCPDCRQYTQTGLVSRTVNLAAGKGPFRFVAATGTLQKWSECSRRDQRSPLTSLNQTRLGHEHMDFRKWIG